MAYRIAVLDDDIRELHRTVKMLSFYEETHPQYELEITCFQEIKPFMEAVYCEDENEKWAFDVLLMDVYLPDGDGIESAQVLRDKGYEGIIIFKSSLGEDAIRAYSVSALHYLVKPVSQAKLDEAMDRAVEKIRQYAAVLAKEKISVPPVSNTSINEKAPEGRKPLGRMIKNAIKKILANE